MTSVYFPESWRCPRVDKISIERKMPREDQTGDRGLRHTDSEVNLVHLDHLIETNPYCRVLRKYKKQIGCIASQNPQIKKALSRIYEGNTTTRAQKNYDLFVINCFLEFIYFATDEVIQELSGDKPTAV
jgi:hypothetical protein